MNQLFSGALLLQAESAPALPADGGMGQILNMVIMFGLIFIIFYFLIIRPQNKRQKEAQKMMDALKRGDKVVTIGGIRGTVHSVAKETVVLKVDDNCTIEFSKTAVATVLAQADAPAVESTENK